MSLNHRYDFVLLFDVKDGNPNGDPDAGNLPWRAATERATRRRDPGGSRRVADDQSDDCHERQHEHQARDEADDDDVMRLDRHRVVLHVSSLAHSEEAPEDGGGHLQQRRLPRGAVRRRLGRGGWRWRG